jgi:hypothetical protein
LFVAWANKVRSPTKDVLAAIIARLRLDALLFLFWANPRAFHP